MDNDKFNEYIKNKEKQMEECNHLFVKLKEGQYYSGFHSSDCGYDPCIVVCLKCGLTNRFIEMDDISRDVDRHIRLINSYYNSFVEVNDKIFRKQFNLAWERSGKSFDDSVFNLISDEVFKSKHPQLLYKIAKEIDKTLDNEVLFNIMKTLHEIETPLERNQMNSLKQVNDLLERYKGMKAKVLKYEKK